MSDKDPIETRWTDSSETTGQERRAAALLEASGEPDTLDASTLNRLAAAAVEQRPQRTSRPRPLAYATVASALLGCVGGASAATWVAGSAAGEDTSSVEIVAIAKGTRIGKRPGSVMEVLSGHVAVRTSTHAAAVSAGAGDAAGLISVGGRSAVEIVVQDRRLVRVGAVEGSATVTLTGTPVVVDAGRAWTPDGMVDQPAGRTRWVRSYLDPQPARQPAVTAAADDDSPTAPAPPKRTEQPAPRKRGRSWAVIEVADDAEVAAEVKAMLQRAMTALHGDRDADRALEIIDELTEQWPERATALPVVAIQVEAFLAAKREWAALDALEATTLDASMLGDRMLVRRAELRARAGRCHDALADTETALAHVGDRIGPIHGRALYWRGACRKHLGDKTAGTKDIQRYLELYPDGDLVDRAKRELGGR